MNTESLGQILAGKRKSLKYKQADVVRMLKERFGIESSVHAISHWEKDASMPSAKQFLALCEIYQIGNNFNQLVRRANRLGTVSDSDIKEAQRVYNKVHRLLREWEKTWR